VTAYVIVTSKHLPSDVMKGYSSVGKKGIT